MADESLIISEIKSEVLYYPSWTIGVTDNPERRKQEHGNPVRWYYWDAITETTARRIEKHFLDKEGMKGYVGGGISPNYVYIFYSG